MGNSLLNKLGFGSICISVADLVHFGIYLLKLLDVETDNTDFHNVFLFFTKVALLIVG